MTTHASKPSYFGDPIHYEFPVRNISESSINDPLLKDENEEEFDDNFNVSKEYPASIERVGSIFIKSGISKVEPFPKFSTEEDISNSKLGVRSKESILNKRSSLRAIDSTKRCNDDNNKNTLVNPYLKGSILRRHQQEVEKDNLLKNRVQIMEDDNNFGNEETENINVEELEIPRRSSKRLKRLMGLSSNSLLRRSTRLKHKDSKKSLVTLNSMKDDIKRSNNSFRSVDMAGLDKMLGELLTYDKKNNEGIRESEKVQNMLQEKNNVVDNNNNNNNNNNNSDQSQGIKPFNVHHSIRRNKSVSRNASSLKNEIRSIKSNDDDNNSNNNDLPSVKTNNEDECELKRSNAIKRKPILIEYLISIFNNIKRFGKKCWRFIKGSNKRNVSFNRNRKNSKEPIKISSPKLVDISKTQFKSQMLNNEIHPTISKKLKENEANQLRNKIKDNGKTQISNYNENNENINEDNFSIRTTIPFNETKLSTIPSISYHEEEDEYESKISINEGIESEDERLILLWKHYLSTIIRNRIDMKLDINNLQLIENIKSIQSDLSRRNTIDNSGKIKIEQMMDKYVTSEISSLTSSESIDTFKNKYSDNNDNRRLTKTTINTWNTITTDNESQIEYPKQRLGQYQYQEQEEITSNEEDENSDFDLISKNKSARSSISSFEEVSDVYDDYSLLSADDEVDNEVNNEADNNTNNNTNNNTSNNTSINDKTRNKKLKQSQRITNFQTLLKTNSELSSHLNSLTNSVYSSITRDTISNDNESGVFSFTQSFNASVCRV